MRILLAFIVLIALSGAASADTITVVNEDGTKSSIEIGPSGVETPAEPARTVTAAPPAVAKPAKKPAPPKQAAKKAKPPKKKKTAKNTQNELDKKRAEPAAPVAAEKAVPVPAPVRRPSESVSRPQRLGPNMTSDDAIRIALDAAPPARSVHASPVNYKGLHAYEVVFRTENGDRFVYVDRESGRIVK